METFQETHITGTLFLKEIMVTPWNTWRDYVVEFCSNSENVNALLLSVKYEEILDMLSILSKVKDAIDKWEMKAAQEDEERVYA